MDLKSEQGSSPRAAEGKPKLVVIVLVVMVRVSCLLFSVESAAGYQLRLRSK